MQRLWKNAYNQTWCSYYTLTVTLVTVIFQEHSCTCLLEILPLAPTAAFCASLPDNSTTFGILKLGTPPDDQHFSLMPVRSWPFAGTGRFLAGLFTFLSRRPIVNWLRIGASGRNSWLWKKTSRTEFSACLSQHYAELQNVAGPTCKWMAAAGNQHKQWTTTYFIQCHPPWLGSCHSWYVLTTNFTPKP